MKLALGPWPLAIGERQKPGERTLLNFATLSLSHYNKSATTIGIANSLRRSPADKGQKPTANYDYPNCPHAFYRSRG
jgi:hypothetical protein